MSQIPTGPPLLEVRDLSVHHGQLRALREVRLALPACGLSLMFGVMRVINLAHGDMAVVAAYLALGVIAVTHVPAVWSFLIVVPLFAGLGYVLQRTLLQSALNRGALTTLLVTFGLSVVVENGLLQFLSANSHSIGIGSLVSASFSVSSQITIAYLDLMIFLVAVVVLLGLQYFLSASRSRSAPSSARPTRCWRANCSSC